MAGQLADIAALRLQYLSFIVRLKFQKQIT